MQRSFTNPLIVNSPTTGPVPPSSDSSASSASPVVEPAADTAPAAGSVVSSIAPYIHPNAIMSLASQRVVYAFEVASVLPLPQQVNDLDPTKAALRRGDGSEMTNFAKWKDRFVEINDALIASHICPADLLGFPCEHDEFAYQGGYGCQKIRLCEAISRWTAFHCRGVGLCPHIHHEVEKSCRFVATNHTKPLRICKQVLVKGRLCSGGHDFELARQTAYDRYDEHREEARALGSMGNVRFSRH